MKRYLLMAALAATLAISPASFATYAYAEDGYSDVESDTGAEAEQQLDQGMDQGEWISDEPTDMEAADSYDPEAEDSQEPTH